MSFENSRDAVPVWGLVYEACDDSETWHLFRTLLSAAGGSVNIYARLCDEVPMGLGPTYAVPTGDGRQCNKCQVMEWMRQARLLYLRGDTGAALVKLGDITEKMHR